MSTAGRWCTSIPQVCTWGVSGSAGPQCHSQQTPHFFPSFSFFLVGCRQRDSTQSVTSAPCSTGTRTPKCHAKGCALDPKSRLQKGCRRAHCVAAGEERSPVPAGDRSGSSRCSADEATQLLLSLIARVAACVRTLHWHGQRQLHHVRR